MGMTEYEKRMIELEKKKVKILTDILKEMFYMNRPGVKNMFNEGGNNGEVEEDAAEGED